MTTIVLVSIGIVLASVAALMSVFYGGDAFNRSDARAQADTLMNAGTNVRTAANMFMVARGRLPTTFASLTEAGAMDGMPAVNGIGKTQDQWLDLGAEGERRKAFVVVGVRDDVCKIVNANVIGAARGDTVLDRPEGLSGCYRSDGENVYYAMLSTAAAPAGAVAPGVRCQYPGGGQSNQDAYDGTCFVSSMMTRFGEQLKSGNSPFTVNSGGNIRLDDATYARGPVAYAVFHPNGDTFFSETPYVIFYLKDDVHSNFCGFWNSSVRPTGAEICNNYYNDHIVFHLDSYIPRSFKPSP